MRHEIYRRESPLVNVRRARPDSFIRMDGYVTHSMRIYFILIICLFIVFIVVIKECDNGPMFWGHFIHCGPLWTIYLEEWIHSFLTLFLHCIPFFFYRHTRVYFLSLIHSPWLFYHLKVLEKKEQTDILPIEPLKLSQNYRNECTTSWVLVWVERISIKIQSISRFLFRLI